MTRREFMNELARLLQNISVEEREEAMKYYHDYFEDAGQENEDAIIKELGSPRRVASIIKKDIQEGNHMLDEGEYTERGYIHKDGSERNYEVTHTNKSAYESQQRDARPRNAQPDNNFGKIALIIVICIFASPFLAGAFGVFVGLLGTVIGLFIGCAGLAFGLTVAGCIMIVVGIVQLIYSFPLGILCVGVGFLLLGFGILCILLTIWLWGTALPSMIRWAVDLCKRLFEKKGVSA